ncbi:MAG: hypothetical protein MJY98_06810 [Fibrobacter sp.]|nr:hypothetical protein [Fibrobacter sp.]
MIKVLCMIFFLLLVACSSDDSVSANEISENTEFFGDVTYSYGIVPVDTTIKFAQTGTIDGDAIVTSSSSRTSFTFRSERTRLYSGSNSSVTLGIIAFYEERGAQIVAGDKNGSYTETFRLLELDENSYVGWLWNVRYNHLSEYRDRDMKLFNDRCYSYEGEFVDYIGDDLTGERNRQLQLSCVFPRVSLLSDEDYLDSIALAERPFVEKYWSVPADSIEPESSMGSSASSGM